MRRQAAVRVEGGAREGDERGQVLEDAGDEVVAELAHPERAARVVHEVAPADGVPEAPVDVAAVARLIREWLRRQRGVQTVAEGHAAHSLSIEHLAIGGGEGRRMANGQLLLAVPSSG